MLKVLIADRAASRSERWNDEAEMTSVFSRRLMAWLVALAVIAGASPVMAASFNGAGPGVSSSDSEPVAPIQAALDEAYAPAIEDAGSRRLADSGAGDDKAVLADAAPALGPCGEARDAHAEPRGWIAAGPRSARHQTGPPSA